MYVNGQLQIVKLVSCHTCQSFHDTGDPPPPKKKKKGGGSGVDSGNPKFKHIYNVITEVVTCEWDMLNLLLPIQRTVVVIVLVELLEK